MESALIRMRHVHLFIIALLGVILMSSCSGAQTATTGGSSPSQTKSTGSIGTHTPSTTNAQTAISGDTVKVDYTGKLEDGTVFDSSIGKTPIEFTLGSGEMIPGFNNAVLGMKVGQSKTVSIPPQDAYGAHLDSLVTTVNRSQMGPGLNPTVGQHLTVTHSDGTTGNVVVTAVTDTTVTVDANHPLAGKTLTFDITLLSIAPKK